MNFTKQKVVACVVICLVIFGWWWLSTPHSFADCMLKYANSNLGGQYIANACEIKFGPDSELTLPRWLIYSSKPLSPIPALLLSYFGVLIYFRLSKKKAVSAAETIGYAMLAYGLAECVIYAFDVNSIHMLDVAGLVLGVLTGFLAIFLSTHKVEQNPPEPVGEGARYANVESPGTDAFSRLSKLIEDAPAAQSEGNSQQRNVASLFYAGGALSLKGRMGRRAFLGWNAFAFMIVFVAAISPPILRLSPANKLVGPVLAAALLPLMWIIIAIYVKRLHDLNRSGAWLLVFLIPYVGAPALLLICCLLLGSDGSNRFGGPAGSLSRRSALHQVIAGSIIFGVLLIGGLAAYMFNPMVSSVPAKGNPFDRFGGGTVASSASTASSKPLDFSAGNTPANAAGVTDVPSLPPGATLDAPAYSKTANQETANQVFQKASPSVVEVLTYNSAGKVAEFGSGVKLADGHVATNCHVLKDGTTYRARYLSKLYAARLDEADWGHDVCALSVPDLPAPPVVLGDTKTLQVGAPVYAIGTPEGLQLTLSEGIVSSLRPAGSGSYIQTTAAISPGSSGGGLFDAQGRLLGLTSYSTKEGQQLNFALPAEWIETLPEHEVSQVASVSHTATHVTSPHHATSSDLRLWSEVRWLNQATEMEDKKNWPGFLAVTRAWVKAQPHNENAWFWLGKAYSSNDRPEEAISAYQRALQLNPKDSYAWKNLRAEYYATGQNTKALNTYQH